MRTNKIAAIAVSLLMFAVSVSAQRGGVTITLDEQFFDAVLDAVFQNGGPPEFQLGSNIKTVKEKRYRASDTPNIGNSFAAPLRPTSCTDRVRLLRENNGVRTTVRFRDGKIYAPLAFSGSYSPPFIGCVEFAGWAETNLDLEFDQAAQRVVARVRVLNVNLNGTGGAGGTVIARLLQNSIDKKLNPIEIMKLEKLSFILPVQNSNAVKMKAVSVRNEIVNGALNVHITFDFLKG